MSSSSSSADSDYADVDINDPLPEKQRAQAISAEADPAVDASSFKPPVHEKTDEERSKLRAILEKNFLFSSLESEPRDCVIEAVQKKAVNEGEVLMRQNEQGDCLYVIESGTFAVWKTIGDVPAERVNTMTPGQAVGELALLYCCPRAATVVAETPGIIWKLDRQTFTFIVREAAMRKRERLQLALSKIPLLRECDQQQLTLLADAAATLELPENHVVVAQGEPGDAFYIIQSGAADAIKNEVCVYHYSSGDFFGELALLSGEPRAATVITKQPSKLIKFDVAAFNRVLKPLQKPIEEKCSEYSDNPVDD